MDILQYITPELLIVAPVLWIAGKAIKQTDKILDKYIPSTLGVLGIGLAVTWVLATSTITGWQQCLLAGFTGVVQGVLCAGVAVYGNELIKQANKAE